MKKIIISMVMVMILLIGCGSGANSEQQASADSAESKEASQKADTDKQEQKEATEEGEAESSDQQAAAAETADAKVDETSQNQEKMTVKVMAPYGAPTLSMIQLIAEKPMIMEQVEVEYEPIGATDVLMSSLVNQEADIAIVPTNMAAVLYNKQVGYKIAGTGIWGILYLISSEEIATIEDLKGKTIGAIGRNLTPDAMLRYVLKGNNIDPDKDVTFEYFSGSSELATNYIAGELETAMAPQPLLSAMLIKRKDAKVVVDLQAEWSKLTGLDSYPQASVIVSDKLMEKNPEFVKAFLEQYQQAIEWTNNNPQEAGKYYEALDIGLKAPIAAKAIPGCNLKFVAADAGKSSIDAYLKILFDFNPKLLGGKMIDEGFYLEK